MYSTYQVRRTGRCASMRGMGVAERQTDLARARSGVPNVENSFQAFVVRRSPRSSADWHPSPRIGMLACCRRPQLSRDTRDGLPWEISFQDEDNRGGLGRAIPPPLDDGPVQRRVECHAQIRVHPNLAESTKHQAPSPMTGMPKKQEAGYIKRDDEFSHLHCDWILYRAARWKSTKARRQTMGNFVVPAPVVRCWASETSPCLSTPRLLWRPFSVPGAETQRTKHGAPQWLGEAHHLHQSVWAEGVPARTSPLPQC
jgi:hypothetical protein